jgi:hypothetical protein
MAVIIDGTTGISATGAVVADSVVGTVIVVTTTSVTGNVTGGNLLTSGLITSTGNITSGNIRTAGLVSATGNITGGNIITVGLISATGNVTGTSLIGTIATAAQTSITSLGTLSTLTINTANVAGTSLEVYNVSSNTTAQLGLHATSGTINRQSKIKFYGTFFNTPGDVVERYVTSIRSGFDSTSNAWGSEFLGVYVNNTSNDANSDANQTLIASFTNYKGLTVFKDITNGQASAVGNIGTTALPFNTIFAKATSAQYADLAENYLADNTYEPGTVVVFGGSNEITVTTEMADERVAGAISTNPAYLMNTGQTGLPVALRGRVPVNVIGPVEKGDSLVTSSVAGYAVSIGRDRSYGQAIFAKSLETNKDIGTKVITAVIL